jgi:AcrR family transcriptional regulator
MPLPRFHRLPVEQQARLVATAHAHLARDGHEASYNQIIAAAGISKASAYHYFDGKADLFGEVRRRLDLEIAAFVGPWVPAATPPAFWAQLRAESARLRARFAAQPDALRVLAVTQGDSHGGPFDPWFDGLIDNGRDLGVVRADLSRSLIRDATRALFSVIDERAIAGLLEPQKAIDDEEGWVLLRALWAQPGGA